MGLLGPVVLDLALFSGAKAVGPLTWAGFLATLFALVLMGWGRSGQAGAAPVTRRWALWALAGWAFSALSMGCQLLSSRYAPQAPLRLRRLHEPRCLRHPWRLSLLARPGGRPRSEELIAGGVTGLMMVLGIPLTLVLLTRIPAAIVFPVTVAGPAVLMLLIGHSLLHERLSPLGWAASVSGVAGIILLSL